VKERGGVFLRGEELRMSGEKLGLGGLKDRGVLGQRLEI
jgi:hypothetical protein